MPEPGRRARLSFAQERLWFLAQFEPASPLYTVSRAVRCRGPLDVEALRGALNAVVARHETLRTTFRDTGRGPEQIVNPPTELPLPLFETAEETLVEELERAARHPFDLARGPLLRASLYRLRPDDHVLLLLLHHIAADGWSMVLLFREMSEIYQALHDGRAPSLPGLPLQYSGFAEWHRDWLQGAKLDQLVAWWKQRLGDLPPVLPLPADSPRPPRRSFRGDHEPVAIPADLAARLRSFSRTEGVTLFMTLLAAFQLLLHRYTGQTAICLGSPIANRTRTEIENLIGFFVNTLVMRADFTGNLTFRELLRQVRETALEAYARQDLPFEKLVEVMEPQRHLSHTPLIQAVFVLQNAGETELRIPGLVTETSQVSTGTAKFDLTLSLEDRKSGVIEGLLNYSTDLFRAPTVRRMFAHYLTLLKSALREPDRPVAKLRMLSAEERRQLLVEWNDTRRPYPQACVHELFQAQADRRPEAVAVTSGDRGLTYGDLARASDRLAAELLRRGTGPGARIGLQVDRSPEAIIGLLGVLKAGAAYVPLDPGYPPERLRFMVEDAGVSLVLAREDLSRCLVESAKPETRLLPVVTPDSPAYVMYTSGSTGVPKGVEVLHRGIVRLVFGADYASFGQDEVFLQLAPLAFDASTFEIWGPLLHGGRCVLYPGKLPSAAELGRVLKDQGVTTLWLTASLFNAVVEEGPEALAPLRQLLIGGEALSAAHVRRAQEALPATEIINGYGPTEATTFTCCYRIPRPLPADVASIPIGRPIANTRVYVLDPNGQPLPVGAPGELYIGGDGLAGGYVNRPELTSQKFLPDPFSTVPGARMYPTGDQVRYLPDGNLEFLERLDEQVKLRGFRIELGEIEAALRSQPCVQDACVMLRKDNPADPRLVAYVAASPGLSLREEDLRDALKNRLPEYMVPARFVVLNSLPLSPNGKVDRSALPRPPLVAAAPADALTLRDPLELRLLSIWRQVLKTDAIGFSDNFFDFGGHSLLALRLLSRVGQACGKRLTLPELFQAPTVEQQAALLRRQRSPADLKRQVSVLQAQGSQTAFFCVTPSRQLLELSRCLDADRPFVGIWPEAWDDASAPRRMEDFARATVRLIREMQPHGPYLLGGWCVAGLVAYEAAQQLREAGEETALLVLFDTFNPAAPRPSAWRYVWMYAERLAFHVSRLVRRQPPDTVGYLRERVRAVARLMHLTRREALDAAAGDYQPSPYSGPLILFRPADRLHAPEWDARISWGGLLTGDLQVCDVPGDHETMFQRPNVDELAVRLRSRLK